MSSFFSTLQSCPKHGVSELIFPTRFERARTITHIGLIKWGSMLVRIYLQYLKILCPLSHLLNNFLKDVCDSIKLAHSVLSTSFAFAAKLSRSSFWLTSSLNVYDHQRFGLYWYIIFWPLCVFGFTRDDGHYGCWLLHKTVICWYFLFLSADATWSTDRRWSTTHVNRNSSSSPPSNFSNFPPSYIVPF
jgi:hypothetical protein